MFKLIKMSAPGFETRFDKLSDARVQLLTHICSQCVAEYGIDDTSDVGSILSTPCGLEFDIEDDELTDKWNNRAVELTEVDYGTNNMLVGVKPNSKVYAFEWCWCVYESGFEVESLHHTKRGAYLAMRKTLLERYIADSNAFRPRQWRDHKPLDSQRWRVREIEVKN